MPGRNNIGALSNVRNSIMAELQSAEPRGLKRTQLEQALRGTGDATGPYVHGPGEGTWVTSPGLDELLDEMEKAGTIVLADGKYRLSRPDK